MPKLVVLYPQPVDAVAFENIYMEEHVPLIRAQMPAVTRLDVARVKALDMSQGQHYWMAQLHFDSVETLQRCLASDGAQRAAGHAQQISTGGAPTMFVLDDVM
jgi:uncharacterized protein (TIGR02118 family)